MKVITQKNYISMPWKNGLGITQEIYKEDYFRISKASIDKDSHFSIFPGQNRILITLEGYGICINEDKNYLEDDIFYFSGDDETYAKLISGPIKDFNIIWDPKLISTSIEIIKGPKQLNLPKRQGMVFFLFNKSGTLLIGDNKFSDEALIILDSCEEASSEGVTYQIQMLKMC